MKKFTLAFCFCFSLSIISQAQAVYNSVAEMLAAVQNPTILRRATSIKTLGYNGVSDGISPLEWKWDSTNTLATNRFRIQIGSSDGRLVYDWDGDVRTFGVKADGVTDDTDALNAAVNYVLASENETETIVFPAGTVISSGISLVPTRHKLLRIRGQTANSASAVEPFGSRILLKPGSTNVLFKIALSTTYRLRMDVKGMYFDGNKDNCPGASDVLQMSGSNDLNVYTAGGIWEECAFNRGARHGILLTNVVAQFKSYKINCQSNAEKGLFVDRGADLHFTGFLAEKSGTGGAYFYNTYTTRMDMSDFGFNGGNALTLVDCRRFMVNQTDIAVSAENALEIIGNTSVGPLDDNSLHNYFVNCSIGSANSSLAGIPNTRSNGLYSNIKFSGDGNTHYGHCFVNCMVFLLESSSATKPKYAVEDVRTGPLWAAYPGGGISMIGCAISSATNYVVLGRFSPGFEKNANLMSIYEHGAGFAQSNSIESLVVQNSLFGKGISTFGSSTNSIPALKAIGGVSASSIFTIDRPGNGTAGFAMSGDALRIMDETNGTQMVAFQDDGSTASMYLGGQGAPRTTRIYGVNPTGTNAAGLPLRLVVGGTGSGSAANANVEIFVPTVGSSGSSAQAVFQAFGVKGEQSGKRTPMVLWDNEAGVLRQVTSTNLTIYHTNGTVLHSGKFLIFE
jgi:hypothetical protein